MNNTTEKKLNILIPLLISACFSLMIGLFVMYNVGMKDGAMKMYMGDAKWEYKVVDGVKIDSCIIFKK